ncbi:MAG: acyl-CoA desaturase [Betaproteobacteria bacterium]|nr:acyl-CoA desaturase [Betaproteobacteria bacterium]
MIDARDLCAADRNEAGAAETAAIRRRIFRELPQEAFAPRPVRAVAALAIASAIAIGSTLLVVAPMPAFAAVLLSVLCGAAYGSLVLIGHEAAHGAVVRSRTLQELLMWGAFAIFMLSPALWRVWHNRVHHQHTNRAADDPDNFDSVDSYHESAVVRFVAAMTPGSGRWLSLLYLPISAALVPQLILWRQSRRCQGFESLNRRRAAAESAAMAAFWCWLAFQLGLWSSLLVIVIPMLVASTIVMSYTATNHFLNPLVDDEDQLATSMGVTTHPWLDLIHFNFSHHAEHHLFPAMSSKYYPLVRAKLRQYAGERFVTPPHWKALLMVFRTPRFHVGKDVLVDPASGRVATVAKVTEALIGEQSPAISSVRSVHAPNEERIDFQP